MAQWVRFTADGETRFGTLVQGMIADRTYALTNGVKSWQASCIQLRDGHHDKNNQPSAYCPLQLTDVHGVSDE